MSLVDPRKLYGEDHADPIVIRGREFQFHENVDDGSPRHGLWLHMVQERAPVFALKPAYDAEAQTVSGMTAIFVAVDLQREIEDELNRLGTQSPTAPTA